MVKFLGHKVMCRLCDYNCDYLGKDDYGQVLD